MLFHQLKKRTPVFAGGARSTRDVALVAQQQVFKVVALELVDRQTPISVAETPTLAEVRWTRKLPFGKPNGAYFVGLKFMF